MSNSTKDYYDIPAEWIPSSNFANRPMSEISDINLVDGLGTFVYSSDSSSSSEADSKAEDDATPSEPRDPAVELELESKSKSGVPPELEMAVTSRTDAPQPRLRSLSNDVKMMDRPRLRRKAATAPPGTLSVPNYAPQPPRRAISARPRAFKGRDKQQASRVAVRLDFGKTRDDDLQKPREQIPPAAHLETRGDNCQTLKDAQLPGSFSQKARVRRTVDKKMMVRLKTDIVDFEPQGLLSSPMSMLNTPREMYATPEQHPASDEPSNLCSPHAENARRSILSSLSGISPTLHLGKTRQHKSMHDGHVKISNLAGWQPIYVAGAICLEEHAPELRKDSVASLDPFTKAGESDDRRDCDLLVVDSITTFFDDLGVMDDTTEECLDRYWHDARLAPRQVASARISTMTITSIEAMPVTNVATPQRGRSPQGQGSRFSFSSASSASSLAARSGTPMRQRDKLKRLLSPAFPGSGFRKTLAG
jgi:hypothetical protein